MTRASEMRAGAYLCVRRGRSGDRSRCSIDVSPKAAEALRIARRSSACIGDGWVFPSPTEPEKPIRRDLLRDWWQKLEAGAKLVKVLPNTQGFDPANRRYLPFYRRLARHQIPFLSHVGYEIVLTGQDQTAGDPNKLRVPLEEGVTVIAAHGRQ